MLGSEKGAPTVLKRARQRFLERNLFSKIPSFCIFRAVCLFIEWESAYD